MADLYYIERGLGQDRQLVTKLDEFRASRSVAALLSGANTYTSGLAVLSVTASSVVRVRLLNIHLHNREPAHMTVLFRDGSVTGAIVAGPFRINPTQGFTVPIEELQGRYMVSGIYALVLSGTFAQGIDTDIGYLLEPVPSAAGGYLE